jgi:hypothetical protein
MTTFFRLFGRFVFVIIAVVITSLVFSAILDALAGRPLNSPHIASEMHYTSSHTALDSVEWSTILSVYVNAGDIDGAIGLIKTVSNEIERFDALKELLDEFREKPNLIPDMVPIPETSGPIPRVAPRKSLEKLKHLQTIQAYLDTLQPSAQRLLLYATLSDQYQRLGDPKLAENIRRLLPSELTAIPKGVPAIVKAPFLLLSENSDKWPYGLLIVALFFMKPTLDVWAKALAFWIHGNSACPSIQKALSKPSSNDNVEE